MPPIHLSAATADVSSVRQLVERRALSMHFQPIARIDDAEVGAHEALVRPPERCRWPTPDALFEAARAEGSLERLEVECVRLALATWTAAGARGRLFVNLGADVLVAAIARGRLEAAIDLMRAAGASPQALVIELTEHERVLDVDALRGALDRVRGHGVGVALDDFGDGRSSLRLWSELQPEYVKVDKYFTRGIDRNGSKVQTLRALQQIAETLGAQLIAEGVETAEELRTLRELGVGWAQGYFLGRPQPALAAAVLPQARELLTSRTVALLPERPHAPNNGITAARLLRKVAPLDVGATHEDAYLAFAAQPEVPSLPIVDGQRPVGLIGRPHFITLFARPFFRELYGRRPVLMHANKTPLTIDLHAGIGSLTGVLTAADQRYLSEGFVITEGGAYRGLGTGDELVRRVTEARIEAARHANPLTFLPGNIPISEHIERLLAGGADFHAAYADLNQFKPFNDQYGYWRGDEMIRLLAQVIAGEVDARRDFVGHVGGDDFVVLFQSADWRLRCERIVAAFDARARQLYDDEARIAGGIQAEDRHGVVRFFPCTTLSLGVVPVAPHCGAQAEDVANAAAAAKREAKARQLGVYVAPPLMVVAFTPAAPRG